MKRSRYGTALRTYAVWTSKRTNWRVGWQWLHLACCNPCQHRIEIGTDVVCLYPTFGRVGRGFGVGKPLICAPAVLRPKTAVSRLSWRDDRNTCCNTFLRTIQRRKILANETMTTYSNNDSDVEEGPCLEKRRPDSSKGYCRLACITAVVVAAVTVAVAQILIAIGNTETETNSPFVRSNITDVCLEGMCVEPSDCYTSKWYDVCVVEGNACIRDGDQWDCGSYGLNQHNSSTRKLARFDGSGSAEVEITCTRCEKTSLAIIGERKDNMDSYTGGLESPAGWTQKTSKWFRKDGSTPHKVSGKWTYSFNPSRNVPFGDVTTKMKAVLMGESRGFWRRRAKARLAITFRMVALSSGSGYADSFGCSWGLSVSAGGPSLGLSCGATTNTVCDSIANIVFCSKQSRGERNIYPELKVYFPTELL